MAFMPPESYSQQCGTHLHITPALSGVHVEGVCGSQRCCNIAHPMLVSSCAGLHPGEAFALESWKTQCRYTHVLKTDDDCYIRYPALVATLQQPPAGKAPGRTSRMQTQMSAVYKGARIATSSRIAHAKRPQTSLCSDAFLLEFSVP